MPRRALVLLCAVACAAPPAPGPVASPRADAPTRGADIPDSSDSTPVPSDSEPVPPEGPRLLTDDVAKFGVLAGGAVLIEPSATWPEIDGEPTYTPAAGLELLDPQTGARSPWEASWRPEGWRLRRGDTADLLSFEVSADGRWVALAHSFEIRRNPVLVSPELVAIVVVRSDGGDLRCVGVGVPSDDPPPYAFSRDGRLIGDWGVRCSPGPGGVPVALHAGTDPDAWPRLQQWYDPRDGGRGEVPEIEPWWHDRDPLGDGVAMQSYEDPRALEFRDFATGARLGAVLLGDRPSLFPREWVSADMLLAEVLHPNHAPRELLLVTTDGREYPAPHPRWRVYTRLPDGTHLFSRDGGATLEQGRVDWPRFTVESSRRRADLEPFVRAYDVDGAPRAQPTWTPGLGGVLIHDLETGGLYLAAT